ncbi:aspic unbv domain protein [Seminavis robusta]|uniref:Aspic unbv domain protein n=1 Tax=Seminavis robusta TaxID=568900 RepID=A0A9N8DSN7_9STRA|nr:aspic unbv domain protein [Seminavis robusta]|eukprot:Sro342_g121830.1 aspic unbv domain protein (323) ;mRNA; r:68522-69620
MLFQRSVLLATMLGGASVLAAFVDVTEQVLPAYTQSYVPFLDIKKTPMAAGVCTLDVNNDGSPDLYFVSGPGFPNALMLNVGSGVFHDVSEQWGLVHNEDSVLTCLAIDLDNDGCDDLVLTGAFTGDSFTGNFMPKNNYCSDGAMNFIDVIPPVLKDLPYTISSSAYDFDHDGLLDLYVSALGGRPLILYGEPNGNHWLGVRLEGTGPKTSHQAIGAVAQLSRKDGSGPKQTLILSAGSAAMSTEEKTLFFGMGSSDVSDYESSITWPGSGETEVFDGFSEPKIVTLVQGTGVPSSVEASRSGSSSTTGETPLSKNNFMLHR